MLKRKLIAKIERMMVEQELELHDLDSQHSRAYHTGIIDGLGMALYALSPKRARRNPISIVWFDEDYDEPRKVEHQMRAQQAGPRTTCRCDRAFP